MEAIDWGAPYWTAVGALATAISSLVVLVSVGALVWQVYELRRATHAQTFSNALVHLQSDHIRSARGTLYAIGESGKALSSWSHDELAAAEVVCASHNNVAVMVRHGMLPERVVLDQWGITFVRTWNVAKPLVLHYREARTDPHLWSAFEWLAERAKRQM
jgi:hypothetical protein